MKQLGSNWTDFHEIRYLNILRKSVEKIRAPLQSDKKSDTLHEDQYTFLIISRLILLRMRNVSDKSCRENQNTHFVFSNFLSKTVQFMGCGGRGKVKPNTEGRNLEHRISATASLYRSWLPEFRNRYVYI